jgi:hypothetical protein
VVVVLAVLLFGYWALMYWGWKKDRQEAQTASSNLQSKNRADLYRKAKEQEEADELEHALNANNAELVKKMMRGSMAKKIHAVRRQLMQQFSTKHKLLGGFFAVNSNYTRPRRFTVLFCMLVGNMFVNALWIGSGEQSTFLQKAVSGVISAMIMFPVSFFFAWIFKNLAVRYVCDFARDASSTEPSLSSGSRVHPADLP